MESELNRKIREIFESFGIDPNARMEKDKRGFISLVLVGAISKLFEEEKRNYENKAGESCVILAKILSQKQLTDITDDDFSFASMNIEAKRKQDEINYIQHLRTQANYAYDKGYNQGENNTMKQTSAIVSYFLEKVDGNLTITDSEITRLEKYEVIATKNPENLSTTFKLK